MDKAAKILFVLLVLSITFGLYQTFRLKKVSVSDANLKYQFMNTGKTQDKIRQDLQEAYKTIDMLKHENARLSGLLEQKQAENKSMDTDKQRAEELKKKAELTLGIMP